MYKIFVSILFFLVSNSSCISQNLDSLYNLIEDNVNNQNYTEALNNTFKYKIIVQSSKKENENNKIKIYEALAEIYKQMIRKQVLLMLILQKKLNSISVS